MLVHRFITIANLAQMLSAATAFFICVSICDVYAGANPVTGLTLVFILLSSIVFCALKIIWHMLESELGGRLPLETYLLLGPILSLPIYFTLKDSPSDLTLLEQAFATVGGYLILPVLIITIQQIPMGWALDLLSVSTLLTGITLRMSKRQRTGSA